MFADFSKINDTDTPDAIEQEAILAEALEQELETEIENYPERFIQRSACCEAELYDDAEFCVECYNKNPDIIYVRR